jgi:hypothetical protein
MSEELLFHPVAIERTSNEARAARDDADWAAAGAPAQLRSHLAGLVRSSPSQGRLRALNEAFDRAYAAFARGDWELNTVPIHPTDYVFESGGGGPGVAELPMRLEGVAAYIDGMVGFRAGWDVTSLRSDAVADAGPGQILNWVRFRLRGSLSRTTLEQPVAALFTWRDDWLVHQQYWWDREAGTRAAGVDPAALRSQF